MKKEVLKKKIYEYNAIFEKHGGYYMVTVPSLPGLVTEGNNLADATYMVKDAIKCYLEAMLKDQNKIFRPSIQKVQRKIRVPGLPKLNYA